MNNVNTIIVCAAVRYPNGRMLVGSRHFDYVMLVQFKALKITDSEDMAGKGFLDQDGNFYTRREAWRIAQRNNQIRYRTAGDEANGGTLFSENLY